MLIGTFNELQGNENERAGALVSSGMVERRVVGYEKLLAAVFVDAVRERAKVNIFCGVQHILCR